MILPTLLACTPSDREVVVRVPVSTAAEVADLEALGDVWTEHVTDHVDVRIREADLGHLGGGFEVLIEDLQDRIDDSLSGGHDGFFEDWRDLGELDDLLAELDGRSPHATGFDLGTSVEGRPIRGLRIAPPGRADRTGLLVVGAQHAREWVSASSAAWVAQRLVDGIGVDPEVDALLAEHTVTVVPVMNPDGYRYTWTTDRLWRKNRRPNENGTFGVDLNRNWDAGFGGPGSAEAQGSNNYRGPEAFSEPETAAIRDLVLARPDTTLHVDLHCTGQVALVPMGFTELPAPDEAELLVVADAVADAMEGVHGTPYRSGSTWDALYPAAGTAIDWSYSAEGLSGTLWELRDRGEYGFLLPPDQIVPTAEEVWAGLLVAAAAPPVRLGLAVDTLIGGSPGEVRASRSPAGATVELWWARGLGHTPIGGGAELGLADAELLESGTAAANGGTDLAFAVPSDWAGRTVWLQVWDGATLSLPNAVEVR